MSKHTPGPWYVVPQDAHNVARGIGYAICAGNPDDGPVVAYIPVDPDRDGRKTGLSREEFNRLRDKRIAAARAALAKAEGRE